MTKPGSRASEMECFLAAHGDIETVEMMVGDMNGILRGKRLERDHLGDLYGAGVRLPGSNYLLDWSGRNVDGLTYGSSDGDPDYFCRALPGTLKAVPWAKKPMAQVLCEMTTAEGGPHFANPRHLLGRQIERLGALGFRANVALEYEFYLIDADAAADGDIMPARSPANRWRQSLTNVYGLDGLADFEDFFNDVAAACQAQDLPAETAVSEYGAGQFEINLHYSPDPLQACDQGLLLERAIREVARAHGLIATFMAKPFAERAGSGLHVHVSLIDDAGANVFAGPHDKALGRGVSDTLRHAVAGLMATMAEGMAIFAPNANSYRRLRPGAYAPVKGQWGGDNRTLPIRMPGGPPEATRLEHRVAGADANPYLVVAAVLAGMAHGIANKLAPPPPVVGDGYARKGVNVPIHWPQALDAFSRSKVLAPALGKEWSRCFLAAKRQELETHHHTIPALDFEWYLRTA